MKLPRQLLTLGEKLSRYHLTPAHTVNNHYHATELNSTLFNCCCRTSVVHLDCFVKSVNNITKQLCQQSTRLKQCLVSLKYCLEDIK